MHISINVIDTYTTMDMSHLNRLMGSPSGRKEKEYRRTRNGVSRNYEHAVEESHIVSIAAKNTTFS